MGHVISDLSKYVITFFMIIYTLECFVAVATKKEHERGGVYIRQIICMFMVHFLGFAAICLETEDVSYIIFYGFQQILLFATIALFRVAYPEADKLVINNMCMLLTISFIMLTRISYQKSIRQFIIVAVSLIIGLFIPFLVSKLKFLKHLTWIYGMVGVFALLVVAVLGSVTHGSKISYSINGFTFQPSEFVKILFVFFIAGLLTESKSLGQVVISAVAAAAHVIILVFSKDLGSAVIFFAGYLIMVFIATKNYFYLFAGILGGAGASIVAYHMFSHVRRRIQAWRDPWSDVDDIGYQAAQSLFAIGTGGWFGMGLYQGMPKKIPVVEKDFIFAAISEEMGAVFALCLLLICLGCFLQFMMMACKMQALFYKLIAFGFGMLYITQVFLAVGGAIKFIPSTGVTLPLVSYGGSSVLSTFMMFGVMQGLFILKRSEEEEDGYDS